MDADDVTQEVLIRIWKNMGNFKIESAKSWIMKTTHNLCLDYIRKRRIVNERVYTIDDDTELNIPDNSEENNINMKTDFLILKDKVKEAVKNLPENLSSVFILYELQGYKYNEISEVLNIPLNSVKVYLLRARKKLQEELKEFENEK